MHDTKFQNENSTACEHEIIRTSDEILCLQLNYLLKKIN